MPKKKKYAEKNIIVEVVDNAETETTTTDSEVEVVFAEEEIAPTVDSLENLTARVESLESAVEPSTEELDAQVIDLFLRVNELTAEVRSHAEHLPVRGTSSPRRHNTYEVMKDGENIVKISKNVLGSSGRYVEILALNGITLDNELKKGQVLDIPIQ